MKNNNHGSTFRMDAYTGEKKGPDTTFAYDAMMGGEKKEEEVTPIGVKGENPVSGTNAGANFRMDAYAGTTERKMESTFDYGAMMGKGKKEEAPAEPVISAKGENPVSGTTAGANFRMDAYAGTTERKVESTFDYGAMMGKGKKEEEAPAEPVISAKGENPVSGNNAGSNFRMDAYSGSKGERKMESAFDFGAIVGKK